MASRKPGVFTAKRLQQAQRRKEVLEERLKGKTWKEIADHFGYADPHIPWELVSRTIKGIFKEEANAYTDLTLARYEKLLAAVWQDAISGDMEAHEQARKVIADSRKMLGIDRPARQEVSGPGGGPLQVTAEELDKRFDEIAKRMK